MANDDWVDKINILNGLIKIKVLFFMKGKGKWIVSLWKFGLIPVRK